MRIIIVTLGGSAGAEMGPVRGPPVPAGGGNAGGGRVAGARKVRAPATPLPPEKVVPCPPSGLRRQAGLLSLSPPRLSGLLSQVPRMRLPSGGDSSKD